MRELAAGAQGLCRGQEEGEASSKRRRMSLIDITLSEVVGCDYW
jgi:hypothetical protein